MNLLFLSSDAISLPSLEELASDRMPDINVVGVITNPDRRSGRGKRLQRNVVAAKAESLGLPVHQTPKLNCQQLAELPDFDAALVFAFGQILPRSVLSLKPDRFLNIHASPLPQLRGPSPIETAIASGWEETEISLMRMVLRMDAGDVAHRRRVRISSTDTGAVLREKITTESANLVHQLPTVLDEGFVWEKQDEAQASWCRKISKKDAELDLSLPALTLADQARAFAGWPGSTLRIGGETVKVADIHRSPEEGIPGKVLAAGERLIVATGKGSLSIGQIQRPSRKMIPFSEFQRTTPVTEGSILPYALSTPLVRQTQAMQ